MYLKTLELQGFKSFPDKSVIEFAVRGVIIPKNADKQGENEYSTSGRKY